MTGLNVRRLLLDVETGTLDDEPAPHLVVSLPVSVQTVGLLQALAETHTHYALVGAIEGAVREVARDEHAKLCGQTDTLANALQAAGPSPERVPPTDPSPAASSSPSSLTALPGGDDPAPPDADCADSAPARRPAARRPATAAARPAAPRPRARRSPFAGPPLRERLLAELADLPSGQTLNSAELQRRCKASQPSTDKALRELANERRALRVGNKGRYGYRLPTAGEKPAPTTEATRASGTASSTPPPLPGRQPLGNGKSGKISARPSGGDGSTFAGRALGALQFADMTVEALAGRLGEPVPDVAELLNEMRAEDDVQRLADGRWRAVL